MNSENFEIVERYGDAHRNWRGKVVHYLHAWDAGERTLIRCRKCGALFLRQDSEFHGGGDAYHGDLFPVESRDEALAHNREYDGREMEKKYGGVRLGNSSAGWQWNKREPAD